jgi:hypothetical protein
MNNTTPVSVEYSGVHLDADDYSGMKAHAPTNSDTSFDRSRKDSNYGLHESDDSQYFGVIRDTEHPFFCADSIDLPEHRTLHDGPDMDSGIGDFAISASDHREADIGTGEPTAHLYTIGRCNNDVFSRIGLHSPYLDLDGNVIPPRFGVSTFNGAGLEQLCSTLTGDVQGQTRHWRWLYRNLSFRMTVEDRVYYHIQHMEPLTFPLG